MRCRAVSCSRIWYVGEANTLCMPIDATDRVLLEAGTPGGESVPFLECCLRPHVPPIRVASEPFGVSVSCPFLTNIRGRRMALARLSLSLQHMHTYTTIWYWSCNEGLHCDTRCCVQDKQQPPDRPALRVEGLAKKGERWREAWFKKRIEKFLYKCKVFDNPLRNGFASGRFAYIYFVASFRYRKRLLKKGRKEMNYCCPKIRHETKRWTTCGAPWRQISHQILKDDEPFGEALDGSEDPTEGYSAWKAVFVEFCVCGGVCDFSFGKN